MRYEKYAPALVRIAIGLIFVVFALDQFIRPEYWFGYLPGWVVSIGVAPETLIMLNATFDMLLGVALLAGLFTRIAAIVATLHLFSIALSLGYNDIAVRDIVLGIIALAIALQGPDRYCAERQFSRRR